MTNPRSELLALREKFHSEPGPAVVFNKSHSGSRLLAQLMEEAGFFMGAHQNVSNDSLDVLELVRHLVTAHHPDYSAVWRGEDRELPALIDRVFTQHLEGFDLQSGSRWGWKLCETTYILPVIDFLFPNATYIHLLRDGRDVAFCHHRPPEKPFWKKIYFNTDQITRWRGMALDAKSYQRKGHIFNAQHWVNSVSLGRAHSAMFRERCMEVRYEDMCVDFAPTAKRILNHLEVVENTGAIIEAVLPRVRTKSVHKHELESKRKVREVLEIEEPLLRSLGYLSAEQ